MRLGRDRAEAHRAGREALDDFLRGLDLLEGDRRALAGRTRTGRATSCSLRPCSLIERCVFLVRAKLFARAACCSFAIVSGVHMCSSPRMRYMYSPPASSASREQRIVAERELDAAAAPPRRPRTRPMPSIVLAVPVKYLSTNAVCKSDRLEDLRAAIGLIRRDAHLRHHLAAGPCRSP